MPNPGVSVANGEQLYCRCGMDHSDPFHRNAETSCGVGQWFSISIFLQILFFQNWSLQFFFKFEILKFFQNWKFRKFSKLKFSKVSKKKVLNPSVKVQYHKDAQGVDGNWDGITIENKTTCAIDLTINPDGRCRKQISAYHPTNGITKVDVRTLFLKIWKKWNENSKNKIKN